MVRFEGWVRILFLVLFLPVVTGFSILNNNEKELSGAFELNELASVATTDAVEGMPERGQFLFIYSYQGQTIEPEISITRNGETAASLNELSTVSSDTLVNLQTDKGDELVFDIQFDNDRATVFLHNSFASFEQGFWANQFSVNFFLLDEDGNPVEFLGTMHIVFFLLPPFNGFEFTGNPTSIAPGEHSTLSLQAVEAPNEPVIVPEATTVALQTSATGIRLGGYSLPDFGLHRVQGITAPYGLLTGTRLWYEADPDSSLLDGTSETVSLLAFSPYDVNINGGTAVEVRVEEEDVTLQLEIIGENEIWPTIPQRGVPPVFRSNLSDLVHDSIELRVTVRSGEEPIENREVTVLAVWEESSGGHNHNGSTALKTPPDSLMGRFTDLASEESGHGKLIASTDSLGNILLRYKAPEFGGKVNLKALLTVEEETIESSQQLIVSVPDLELLPEGEHYRKVGGVPNHHGPRQDDLFQDFRNPDNNHYGTQAFVDSLISLANTWHDLVINDETMDDRQTPLNINDMSLPNGGLFDIGGRWQPSHHYHRLGRDVDIRTTQSFPMIPAVRNGVLLTPILDTNGNPEMYPDGNIIRNNSFFEDLWEEKGANPTPSVHFPNTNDEHYHVYFY